MEVRLGGTSITARTDQFGEARLSGIGAGSHEIDARRLGYAPRAVAFTAQVGDTLHLLLLLDRAARSFDTVRALIRHLKAYIADWNSHPTPFVWTNDPATIVKKAIR